MIMMLKVRLSFGITGNKEGFCEFDASEPDDELKRTIYMCSECNYLSKTLRCMKKHKKTCTGEKVPSSKKSFEDALKTRMYVCPECEFFCGEENEMKQHYLICDGGKVSVACQTIEDQNLTNTPLVVLARPCISVACQTIDDQNLTSTPLAVLARTCGTTPGEDQNVSEAKTKVSTECQTDPVKFVRHKDEQIQCTHCSYSTTKLFNYKMHLSKHTGEKPHGCPYCDKKFFLKSDLTRHERTHTGDRPFACDVCNKTFGSRSIRYRHKIRWHTDERPFVCEICRMGFKFKPDLKNHKKTHNFG